MGAPRLLLTHTGEVWWYQPSSKHQFTQHHGLACTPRPLFTHTLKRSHSQRRGHASSACWAQHAVGRGTSMAPVCVDMCNEGAKYAPCWRRQQQPSAGRWLWRLFTDMLLAASCACPSQFWHHDVRGVYAPGEGHQGPPIWLCPRGLQRCLVIVTCMLLACQGFMPLPPAGALIAVVRCGFCVVKFQHNHICDDMRPLTCVPRQSMPAGCVYKSEIWTDLQPGGCQACFISRT